MKHFIKQVTSTGLLLALLAAVLFTGCAKDKTSEKFEASGNPQAAQISPATGSGNTVLTLTGTGLGDIRTIKFSKNDIPAEFNPVFNTDGALVFRVPTEAYGGVQEIEFTNAKGVSFKVPFTVIALPLVTTASITDFQENTLITLTGNNLDDVISVLFDGTPDAVTVVSKTRKSMVIKMPASTALRTKLKIKNASGEIVTSQVFVNIDQAYTIYKDGFNPIVDNWSWSMNITDNTTNWITGTKGMEAAYTGDWGGMQLHLQTPLNLAPYKEVSFWVKGADVEKKVRFFLNWSNMQTITVPPNVWTYYNFDLQPFKNAGVNNFDTWVMQIEDAPKTFYLDNLAFLK